LIHDSGSLPGVGGVCKGGDFGSVNGNGFGGCGRIGYGYQWTDFAPAVQYASNNFGGLSFRVGLFDPIGVDENGARAEDLRFEGEVNFNTKAFDVWASFAQQDTKAQAEISAFDVGGEFRIAGLALTAAYTKGTGIEGGFMSPNSPDLETTFWYAEADYTIGKLLIGASFGENEDELEGFGTVEEGSLTMFFVHYNLTPKTTLVLEISNEENEVAGVKTFDQDIIALGAQVVF
jgi:predicted porin